MITQDDIFGITDDAAFEAAALEVFRRQAAECPPYREYLALAGVRPEEVRAAREIPFLPIEIFKTHDVYCGGTEPEAVFTSSATTGMTPSRHPMRSLALYERTFRAAFRTFYGEPGQWSLYALLPNYLRRKGSSLVYMADRLIADCGSGGFYLDDYDALLTAMQADPKPKILLGVSYALWYLAERYNPDLEAEGKNPFQLDSKEPNWEDFQGFLKGEVRYASVMKQYPTEAEELFKAAEENAKWRYNSYKRLARENWGAE